MNCGDEVWLGHCDRHTVSGVSSTDFACCWCRGGSHIKLSAVEALEATTDTLCQERSPLPLWVITMCVVLLSLRRRLDAIILFSGGIGSWSPVVGRFAWPFCVWPLSFVRVVTCVVSLWSSSFWRWFFEGSWFGNLGVRGPPGMSPVVLRVNWARWLGPLVIPSSFYVPAPSPRVTPSI